MLTTDQQLMLVAEAARAPSVHNVQPARWRFGEGDVVLLREPGRELPVGDPSGRDLEASLGAAWEGMSIALSRLGYRLGAPGRVASDGDDDGRGMTMTAMGSGAGKLPGGGAPPRPWIPVARASMTAGAAPDPLAAHVQARRSHRGRFLPATDDARARLGALAGPDAIIIHAPAAIAQVATLHDRASMHFESNPAYHRELWSWLRLSPSHPGWSRDGLNADCLALSRAERAGARLALRPRVFALLARLGIARHLVSEAAQVRSAAAVVLFAPSRSLHAFDTGRRFYRLWLEIAAAGLHAVPMSATSDYAETHDALTRAHAVSPDRRIANVLRAGFAHGVAASPRLAARELLTGV